MLIGCCKALYAAIGCKAAEARKVANKRPWVKVRHFLASSGRVADGAVGCGLACAGPPMVVIAHVGNRSTDPEFSPEVEL
jgi:hypothetical protein